MNLTIIIIMLIKRFQVNSVIQLTNICLIEAANQYLVGTRHSESYLQFHMIYTSRMQLRKVEEYSISCQSGRVYKESIYLYLALRKDNNMQERLVLLADAIAQGVPSAQGELQQLISEPANFHDSLEALSRSDAYVLAYSAGMTRLIESSQFPKCQEPSKILSCIARTAIFQLLATEKPHFITQSLLDLAAVCFMPLLRQTDKVSELHSAICQFIPNYQIANSYTDADRAELIKTAPNINFSNLKNLGYILRMLKSVLKIASFQSPCHAYYQFRKNFLVFKSAYLPLFVVFAVDHIKGLFAMNSNYNLRAVICLSLELAQAVLLCPFTLSTNETEADKSLMEGSSGIPSYFRSVTFDEFLIANIMSYFHYILEASQAYEECKPEVDCIIKIVDRCICLNHHLATQQSQRQASNNLAQKIIEEICSKFKFYDPQYLHSIIDLMQMHFQALEKLFLHFKFNFLQQLLNFFRLVASHSEIGVINGLRNPLSRVFCLINGILNLGKQSQEVREWELLKAECQLILEVVYGRITGSQADSIVFRYGSNMPTQIENFNDLFESIANFIVPRFHPRNLEIIEQLNLQNAGYGAKVMWLHLFSRLFPRLQMNARQTALTLKFYGVACSGDCLASLAFMRTMASQILSDCCQGISATPLWGNIREQTGVNFEQFMLSIIKSCVNNFRSSNNEILDYSIQFFKFIYIKLRENHAKSFQVYYNIVKDLLSAIHTTIFVDPLHYEKRTVFFNVISTIWIKEKNFSELYELYNIVRSDISSGTSTSFYKYLHDITGIIEPITSYSCFEAISNLAIEDLRLLLQTHFKISDDIRSYMSNSHFLKIFCKLILSFVSEKKSHTDIPLKIQRLMQPCVEQLIEYIQEIPQNLIQILAKMAMLNPLMPLANFQSLVPKIKASRLVMKQQFSKLVNIYFQNMGRVAEIDWMYDLIQSNVKYLILWWEEIMFRSQTPNISVKVIAESRIWKTVEEKYLLAKLLYQLGCYNQSYWDISGFQGEKEFVNYFFQLYAEA